MDVDFTLEELFEACFEGIELEIQANHEHLAESGLLAGIEVGEGRLTLPGTSGAVEDDDNAHRLEYYRFSYENPLVSRESGDEIPIELPAGASCSFIGRGRTVKGRVQEHLPDEKELVVGLRESIGERGISGELEFNLDFLLESLEETIEAVERKCPVDDALFERCDRFVDGDWDTGNRSPRGEEMPSVVDALELNEYQRKAIANVLDADHHLVWGPPGTGKTRTLGASALALLQERSKTRDKLMVTSHTNVALDNAISSVVGRWRETSDTPTEDRFAEEVGLWRHGRPFYLDAEEERLADALFDRCARREEGCLPQLRELESILEQVDRRWSPNEEFSLRRRISYARQRASVVIEQEGSNHALEQTENELAETVGDVLDRTLSEANIVCCTLSRVHLDFETYTQLDWQKALVDEISMVGLAQLLPILGLDCSIAGFGDFQQLPPIVRSRETAAITRTIHESTIPQLRNG